MAGNRIFNAGLPGTYKYFPTGSSDTVVKASSGVLLSVTVAITAAGTISIYNVASASYAAANFVASMNLAHAGKTYIFNAKLSAGLFFCKTGTATVTLVYQ